MKTEDHAWRQLRERGARQLPAGFADRVLRAARARADAIPLYAGQMGMCVATAAFCLLAVALFHSGFVGSEDSDSNIAGWQDIAAQAADLDQAS